MKRLENFKAGFIRENPIFGLYLGLCSALAISTSLNNAIGMGLSVTAVLICSNIIISLIRKITPDEIRIPVYIVVIAALVKSCQLLIQAYAESLYTALGLFLPLIVVNCIILGRAEAFASKNGIVDSAIDGLGMGLGYTLALTVMSVIRQVLSTGMLSFSNPMNPDFVLFETTVFPSEYAISFFKDPFGAFVTFAFLAAGLTAFKNTKNKKAWKIGTAGVVVVLLAFIGLRSEFAIDNSVVVEETPNETVAAKIAAADLADVSAEVVSTTDNGDGTSSVVVSSTSFGGSNEFTVVLENGAVKSVAVNSWVDTAGVSDAAKSEDYLAKFVGIDSAEFEIDTNTGATFSTKSVVKAVATALEAVK